jgi:hypothetical protein
VKALALLILRALIVIAAIPISVIIVQVVFHPGNGDGGLAYFPILLGLMLFLMIGAFFFNQRFMQLKQAEPLWIKRWWTRLAIRLLVVLYVSIVLLAINPTF